MCSPIYINKKHLFVVPNQEHIEHIIQLEEERIPLTYNTLMYKRMVEIDEHIGSFELARWKWTNHKECTNHKDLIHEHWFHWEYYAMGSPIWLERLKKFGGRVNNIKKTIEFDSDKDQEDFYELYAYNIDELPKEVQNMSLKPLLKTNGNVWYNWVFGVDNDNDLDNDNDNANDDIWLWVY